MVESLKRIFGYQLPSFPLKLEKVGDLMYFDGPLMSVYSDQNDSPFICDWVESNDEINRWLVYQVSQNILLDYINFKTTHFQLINNSLNDLIFVIDKNHYGEIQNTKVCSPKNIPYEYLPQSDIKFEIEDAVNLENIKSRFKPSQQKPIVENISSDILDEAKKSENELINLHIKSNNKKVGYGRIYSSILGKILSHYHSLSSAAAINVFDDKSKIPKDERPRRKKGELKDIKNLAELEFIYAKAASFSVFLRPIKQTINLFNQVTSSEQITRNIFDLFEASQDIEKLKNLKEYLNDKMLTSYNIFLKEIKEQDISVSILYANPKNELTLEESFNAKKAYKILLNLGSLEFENKKEIKSKGIFKALDSTNATFKFETNDGDTYYGKFSSQLKEGIYYFNLQDYYSVTIEILETKKSGKKGITEKVIINSCVKIDE